MRSASPDATGAVGLKLASGGGRVMVKPWRGLSIYDQALASCMGVTIQTVWNRLLYAWHLAPQVQPQL